MTGQALAAFSIGLPSYILVKVLTPGYYARHDTRTPVRLRSISIAVNLVLNSCSILPLGHVGPPLATASPRPSTSGCSTIRCKQARPFRGRCAAAAPDSPACACGRADGRRVCFDHSLLDPYLTGSIMSASAALVVLVGAGSPSMASPVS